MTHANPGTKRMNATKKAASLMAAMLIALVASMASAEGGNQIPDLTVEVQCEDGSTDIVLREIETGSSIVVGGVDEDGVGFADAPARVLRPETQQWIATEIFGSGRDADLSRRRSPADDFASCEEDGPEVLEATIGCVDYLHMCVCYPDSPGDCDIFHTICAATGGTSGHNACYYD